MLKNIIHKILSESVLIEKPPVLIDIGASEQIHNKWKPIVKYSTCLAFDADERDFQFVESEKSKYKRLLVYNSIALDKDVSKAGFYLTKSPYCSSVLEPDQLRLKPLLFSNLFNVDKKIELNAIHIQKALDNAKLEYVDWFKSDSQGIDLRLFKSLNENIIKKILVAEFEPGIIDAYLYEDKLHSILKELPEYGFWLSDIKIKGVVRLPIEMMNKEFESNLIKKLMKESLKKAPGWGEMTFINSFENDDLGQREYLLGWLFSTLERQHAFAFNLAQTGVAKFNNSLFKELKQYSKAQMKMEIYKLKFLPSLFELIKKKFF